jgi:hypothetical protein
MKPAGIYTPQTANALPWEAIEARYTNLIALGLHQCKHACTGAVYKKHRANKKLFGYTSMHKLVLTIYDPPEWNREALHIEFNPYTKKWHFEYHSKPFEPTEAERIYAEENGIAKFSQYLDWLKW